MFDQSQTPQIPQWVSALLSADNLFKGGLIGTVVWAVKSFHSGVAAQTRANDRLLIAFSDIDTLKAWRTAVDARIIELETKARINQALHDQEAE